MQTATTTTTKTQRPLVLSYLGLRRSLGVIGIMLPIVLPVGKLLVEGPPALLDSLSAYYYTMHVRDVWVGSLCAAGVFLLSYRYARQDDIVGDLAGISAIGVALFPTAPTVVTDPRQVLIGRIHTVFAAIFLLTLAYFALVLFRKTDRHKPPTRQKIQRNRIYLVCGLTILACLALLGLMQLHLLPVPTALHDLHPAFWLQSLALWAFGLAWFVKGETILKDK